MSLRRVFHFRKAVLKPYGVFVGRSTGKARVMLGIGKASAAFSKAAKKQQNTQAMWLGRELGAEKDKQMQSSTQRKSTNIQGRYSRSVSCPT